MAGIVHRLSEASLAAAAAQSLMDEAEDTAGEPNGKDEKDVTLARQARKRKREQMQEGKVDQDELMRDLKTKLQKLQDELQIKRDQREQELSRQEGQTCIYCQREFGVPPDADDKHSSDPYICPRSGDTIGDRKIQQHIICCERCAFTSSSQRHGTIECAGVCQAFPSVRRTPVRVVDRKTNTLLVKLDKQVLEVSKARLADMDVGLDAIHALEADVATTARTLRKAEGKETQADRDRDIVVEYDAKGEPKGIFKGISLDPDQRSAWASLPGLVELAQPPRPFNERNPWQPRFGQRVLVNGGSKSDVRNYEARVISHLGDPVIVRSTEPQPMRHKRYNRSFVFFFEMIPLSYKLPAFWTPVLGQRVYFTGTYNKASDEHGRFIFGANEIDRACVVVVTKALWIMDVPTRARRFEVTVQNDRGQTADILPEKFLPTSVRVAAPLVDIKILRPLVASDEVLEAFEPLPAALGIPSPRWTVAPPLTDEQRQSMRQTHPLAFRVTSRPDDFALPEKRMWISMADAVDFDHTTGHATTTAMPLAYRDWKTPADANPDLPPTQRHFYYRRLGDRDSKLETTVAEWRLHNILVQRIQRPATEAPAGWRIVGSVRLYDYEHPEHAGAWILRDRGTVYTFQGWSPKTPEELEEERKFFGLELPESFNYDVVDPSSFRESLGGRIQAIRWFNQATLVEREPESTEVTIGRAELHARARARAIRDGTHPGRITERDPVLLEAMYRVADQELTPELKRARASDRIAAPGRGLRRARAILNGADGPRTNYDDVSMRALVELWTLDQLRRLILDEQRTSSQSMDTQADTATRQSASASDEPLIVPPDGYEWAPPQPGGGRLFDGQRIVFADNHPEGVWQVVSMPPDAPDGVRSDRSWYATVLADGDELTAGVVYRKDLHRDDDVRLVQRVGQTVVYDDAKEGKERETKERENKEKEKAKDQDPELVQPPAGWYAANRRVGRTNLLDEPDSRELGLLQTQRRQEIGRFVMFPSAVGAMFSQLGVQLADGVWRVNDISDDDRPCITHIQGEVAEMTLFDAERQYHRIILPSAVYVSPEPLPRLGVSYLVMPGHANVPAEWQVQERRPLFDTDKPAEFLIVAFNNRYVWANPEARGVWVVYRPVASSRVGTRPVLVTLVRLNTAPVPEGESAEGWVAHIDDVRTQAWLLRHRFSSADVGHAQLAALNQARQAAEDAYNSNLKKHPEKLVFGERKENKAAAAAAAAAEEGEEDEQDEIEAFEARIRAIQQLPPGWTSIGHATDADVDRLPDLRWTFDVDYEAEFDGVWRFVQWSTDELPPLIGMRRADDESVEGHIAHIREDTFVEHAYIVRRTASPAVLALQAEVNRRDAIRRQWIAMPTPPGWQLLGPTEAKDRPEDSKWVWDIDVHHPGVWSFLVQREGSPGVFTAVSGSGPGARAFLTNDEQFQQHAYLVIHENEIASFGASSAAVPAAVPAPAPAPAVAEPIPERVQQHIDEVEGLLEQAGAAINAAERKEREEKERERKSTPPAVIPEGWVLDRHVDALDVSRPRGDYDWVWDEETKISDVWTFQRRQPPPHEDHFFQRRIDPPSRWPLETTEAKWLQHAWLVYRANATPPRSLEALRAIQESEDYVLGILGGESARQQQREEQEEGMDERSDAGGRDQQDAETYRRDVNERAAALEQRSALPPLPSQASVVPAGAPSASSSSSAGELKGPPSSAAGSGDFTFGSIAPEPLWQSRGPNLPSGYIVLRRVEREDQIRPRVQLAYDAGWVDVFGEGGVWEVTAVNNGRAMLRRVLPNDGQDNNTPVLHLTHGATYIVARGEDLTQSAPEEGEGSLPMDEEGT